MPKPTAFESVDSLIELLLALRLRGDAGELLARCLLPTCRLSPPATAPPAAPAFLPRASCFSILSMARNIASNLRSSRDFGLSFLAAGVDVAGVLVVDVVAVGEAVAAVVELSSLASNNVGLLVAVVGVVVVAFAGVLRVAGVVLTLLLQLLMLLLLSSCATDLVGVFVGEATG